MPSFIPAWRAARRLTPVAVELYRRWDRLTPDEKARHRERVMKAADRVRDAARTARPGRGGKRKR
jgi:hypothetical protein